MKTIDQVWAVYIQKKGNVDESSLGELRWHIENDEYKGDVISMAEDMIMESDSPLMKRVLIPAMAKQLHSQSSSARKFAMMALGRMELPEYGQDIYNMARYDPEEFCRMIATRALGGIMNEVDKYLKQKIVVLLYEILTNNDLEVYGKTYRDKASDAVLSAMDYNYLAFCRAWNDPDFDPIWKDFVKKYKLEYKPVFRR
jgi:hypothetical protein